MLNMYCNVVTLYWCAYAEVILGIDMHAELSMI